MITKPMDVLSCYPVRKNKKQKASFRDEVQSYVESLGYVCETEKGSLGAQNLVIGDPKSAKYLVTAHYDTPPQLPIPNFITPCNFGIYLLYQFAIVAIFIVAAIIPGVILGVLLDNPEISSIVSMVVYWGLLIMLIAGPANKHNANDNTSGIVTVLETARNLPVEYRDQVCFVLFDLEEAGLIGSSSYRKLHKKESNQQIALNCDCVGDGNEMVLFPTKKLKKNTAMMHVLLQAETKTEKKTVCVHRNGFSFYPSDQMNFPYGVGISAFRRKKLIGIYCDKIHTRKDTILEEENVIILSRQLMKILCGSAQ